MHKSPLLVDGTPVNPVQSVRDLGRPGDANPCAKDGFQVLRNPQATTFNSSFSDSDYVPDSYCLAGTVEAGLRKCRLGRSPCLFQRLQSVMNGAARLIYGLRHSDHNSDALIILHCLRAQERVRFKTAVLTYKATHGTAPSYLSQLVRVADLSGRRSLRSARTKPSGWCRP